MVDDEKIEEWIQGKLDDGIEPERIKKSLENTGHDPELVDKIDDPFADEESEQEEDEEPGESDEGFDNPDDTDLSSNQEFETEDVARTQDTENASKSGGTGGSSMFDVGLPEINLSAPGIPSPDFTWKRTAFVAAVFLLASVGGIFAFTGVASVPELSSLTDKASNVANSGGSGSCPDVGTEILSASISDGKTWVKVDVTGGSSDTVVEIFEGEEMKGSKSKTLEGTSVVIVDGVGTRAVFRPAGCSEGDEVSLT